MSIDIDYENPWIYLGVPFDGSLIRDNYGLFITLPISPTNDNTLGESIFGVIGNLQERNAE
jgi:hypothetical protein